MIESIAKAIFENWPFEFPDKGVWDSLPEAEKEALRKTPKAVLSLPPLEQKDEAACGAS